MELMMYISIIGGILALICVMMILLSGQFFFYGIMFNIKKMMFKDNMALVFIRNLNGNFRLPQVVNIKDKKFEDKLNKWNLNEETLFKDGTFFGRPYVMFPDDDSGTSIGLYYQQNGLVTDQNGKQYPEPLFYTLKQGDETIETGIPILKSVKPSIMLPPDLHMSVAIQEHLSTILRHLKDNKTIYLLIIAGGALSALSAYLMFTAQSQTFPDMQAQITQCVDFARSCAESSGRTILK
jgi:hypothetical protein